VPALTEAKLARRLNCYLPQIDRLLDLLHGSRIYQLEAAFSALGKRITIVVEEAALATSSPSDLRVSLSRVLYFRPEQYI